MTTVEMHSSSVRSRQHKRIDSGNTLLEGIERGVGGNARGDTGDAVGGSVDTIVAE